MSTDKLAQILAGQRPCPLCGQQTAWDVTHQPNGWRHIETDSRWCESGDYPANATRRDGGFS